MWRANPMVFGPRIFLPVTPMPHDQYSDRIILPMIIVPSMHFVHRMNLPTTQLLRMILMSCDKLSWCDNVSRVHV